MASSGTYALDFEVAELVEESFERCGIDPATLTMRHARSARRSLNLLFSLWATKEVRLFTVDEQTQTLTDGDASYTAASGTLVILESVVRRSSVDTPVHLITREQYHMIPNKTAEGLPTQLFFDRKAGTYYLWNTPENSTDVLRYWRMRRIQDVSTAAETMDVPYVWFEATAAGLAEFLSLKYAIDRHDKLKGLAEQAFGIAQTFSRERADASFSMSLP